MAAELMIEAFFDKASFTVSYLVADPAAGVAAVIDPVLDFDEASGRIATSSADAILARAAALGLRIMYVLETHAHADHLSGARHMRARTGCKVAIGAHITAVQEIFAPVFDLRDLAAGGADFDLLLEEGARLPLGALQLEVLHVPGHTPADVAYRIADAVFVGDTLFMPDYGTARADFPGGDAGQLYRSIRRLLSLPDETRLFMCHDYKAPGRTAFCWESSVALQRHRNIHVHEGVAEADFIAMRQARDATLATPRLLLPAIQVNIRAGRLPPPAANGTIYLRLPLTGEGLGTLA